MLLRSRSIKQIYHPPSSQTNFHNSTQNIHYRRLIDFRILLLCILRLGLVSCGREKQGVSTATPSQLPLSLTELAADNPEADNNRSTVYAIDGDSEQALSNFQQAIEIEHSLAVVHFSLVILYYTLTDYPQSLPHLRQTSTLIRKNSDIAFQLTLTYQHLNQLDQAISIFSTVIKKENGFDVHSYYVRGLIFAEKGNIAQAQMTFIMPPSTMGNAIATVTSQL